MRKVSIMPVISMDCVETFAAVAAISCMDIVFIKPHGAECRAAFSFLWFQEKTPLPGTGTRMRGTRGETLSMVRPSCAF